MSNKKQTAVEWLVEKWSIQGTLYSSDINQAKEIHKEEIDNSHTLGYIIGGGNGDLYDCKQYYKETFNTKEK